MCSVLTCIVAVVFFVAPLAAGTQPAENVHRIGFLGNSTAALEVHLVGSFREGLRDLGYVEGQNIVIEYRWAEGKYERFPALIAELLAQKVEMIVTAGTPASLAVKRATTSIPLVMVGVGDPVDTGLVASLARPGGNITGINSTVEGLEGKRLELLREVIPKLSHLAVFWNPENPTLLHILKEMQAAAQVLGITLQVLEVRTSGELEETFKAIVRVGPGALRVTGDRLFLHHRQRIMDFATTQRLPMVPTHPELVEAGGLLSYGPSYPGMHRRASIMVSATLCPRGYPTAFRGGLRGAGGRSTDSKIATNIERGFCPKKRSAAVVPSARVRKKL
jgi:putative ABC transport system substrate-binding protein